MHTLKISEAEIQELNYERFYYPCPTVQKRLHCIYLKSKFGFSNKELGKILSRHPNTIAEDIKRFESQGTAGLKVYNYGTNKSELEEHKLSIEEAFRKEPPHSIKEARERIKVLTGIERSPTQIRVFLKRLGLRYIKTGQIPGKADPKKQRLWLREELNPVIEKAKQGQVHLVFMDAAHFVLGPFLCFLWCFQRIFIKSPAGRQRVNVLGAVDAITQKIHFMSNQTYINATTIVDFLYQLRIYYFDMKPIYIVLDNARYQHCYLVRSVAGLLNIHLLFLPPYSPNLNIIERLWKFIKKKCLYAIYYDTFDKFEKAILDTLKKSNHDQTYIKELNSLLNLKFQLF